LVTGAWELQRRFEQGASWPASACGSFVRPCSQTFSPSADFRRRDKAFLWWQTNNKRIQKERKEEDRTLTQNAEPDSAALEGIVAFTGRLASMSRADAFALVRTHGGKPREGVTKHTDLLIGGEVGWPLLDGGRPSNSLARAKSYRGLIASERQFLEWLGTSAPEEQAKTYTADQLASLSKLPEEIVDQLSMFGLIKARQFATKQAH
jgi:hypothetical protein